MLGSNVKPVAYRIGWVFAVVLVLSSAINSEQLPIKTYTIADGLVSNKISRIARDTRGFLWFCTEEGLSRFDGYTFTNYTTEQGLPSNWVDDFLETRSGFFLVATSAGLCIFDPNGVPLSQHKLAAQPDTPPMFAVYRPDPDEFASHIKVLFEDSAANIWCGTRRGLYRIEMVNSRANFHYVELGIQSNELAYHRIRSIVEEPRGALWIATAEELYQRFSDGRTKKVTSKNRLPDADLMGIIKESDGRLWVGTGHGLYGISQSASDFDRQSSVAARFYSVKEGLPCAELNTLFQSYDGRIWIGTACGLYEFLKKEERFRRRLDIKSMRDARVWAFNEDVFGNLWIGTAVGAIRLARDGFSTYTEADGIGFRDIYRITESSFGDINLYTRFDNLTSSIDRFDGEGFVSQKIKPHTLAISSFDWYQGQIPIRDHQGEWWWPTSRGLYRFAQASRIEDIFKSRPIAHYTVKDGLPDNFLRGIYEDRRGDIWISMGSGIQISETETKVVRWERATGKFHTHTEAEGLPAKGSPSTVCEDQAGNFWIGFQQGGITRYSQGRFTTFTSADGVPEGEIKQLFGDSRGRVWIASNNSGLGRIDDPASKRPQMVIYTVLDGLASNSILSIAEDRLNRFYVATTRGLNYIDFDTGSVKRFTANHGLANDQVDLMFRDSSGAFWFGTSSGVSRLLPQTEVGQEPPSIFISGIKVVGETQPISEVGETDLRGLELATNQNHIEIDFGSLFFATGDLLRYQYKLEGADADWQPLTFQRSVNYANLKPGSYHFFVCAVNSEGQVSLQPAMLEFRVLAPIWQRWWFVGLGGVFAGLLVYALYRYRVARLLELERIRTRIATDLHDDIGANLSLIAMASEVARGRSREEDQQMTETLSLISGTSRELVDSMSDIVWAVNPERDHLFDLVKRMRRFASDVLSARHIAFRFEAPIDDRDIRLGTETRREVLLIFKEAINNIARHSGCAHADIEFKAQGAWLMLKLKDNGNGFDTRESVDGNGLVSMGRRAERLGGTLEIISRPGEGTVVILKTPLR
jgi:signal transduction histidine kinase/ligand-binding sensor domain-containing protein